MIEPGPITANIRINSQKHFEHWVNWKTSKNITFYEKKLIPRLYSKKNSLDFGELPPAAVTKKIIHALESKNPCPRYYVTLPTYMFGMFNRLFSTRILDWIKTKI